MRVKQMKEMPGWRRWRLLGGLGLVALLAAACLPTSEDYARQGPLLAALARKSGMIAYIGNDGNVYTINQAGGDQQALTDDARLAAGEDGSQESLIYLFPTWSRDSERVAFAQLTGPPSAPVGSKIYTAAVDGADLRELYRSESAQPIYLYWSPDDRYLSFLSNATRGGLLLQTAAPETGEVVVLDAGQPLYWSWAPNGNQLLVHIGSGTEQRLSYLTLQEKVIEDGLPAEPTLFQAPAWSPDGRRLLFTGQTEAGQNGLILMDQADQSVEPLAELPLASAAFAWSPDSRQVAYVQAPAQEEAQSSTVLGPLTVVDLERPESPIVWDEGQVLAFFWSPNSRKIAFFVPRRVNVEGSESGGSDSSPASVLVLGLHIMDLRTGTSERIQIFQPTPEMMGVLPFFDQYHHSATIWSPDSQNVVVTGYTGENRTPAVLVINASGELEPRAIADGKLAFWSWE